MAKKSMEFMKRIVVWAITMVTIFSVISMTDWILNRQAPAEALVNMMGLLITGVIVSYAGKAGVENYQKIKVSSQTASVSDETEGGKGWT